MNKLNFGCGRDIRKGWDNVDIQKGLGILKSFDFNKIPYPLKENHYDYIYLDNVLEHLQDPQKVLAELWRIGKKNATIEIIVPHYSNKGAYSDIEHIHFYNELCFINFADRKLKTDRDKKFDIIKIKITPTRIGKFLPKKVRENLSLFINGLLSQVHVQFRVRK